MQKFIIRMEIIMKEIFICHRKVDKGLIDGAMSRMGKLSIKDSLKKTI